MKRRLIILGILFLVTAGLPAADLEFEGVEILSGLQFFGSAEGENPVQQLKAPVSLAFPVRITDWFLFAPEMSLFWFPYAIGDSGRPAPVEIERKNRVEVLHWLVDPQFRFEYQFLPDLAGGLTISPVFFFRIPGIAYDDAEDNRKAMTDYFYGQGRWFYPQTGIYLDWRPYRALAVVFRSRIMYPLFHAWDNENLSFVDQFVFDVSIGIRIGIQGWDDFRQEAEGASADKSSASAEP